MNLVDLGQLDLTYRSLESFDYGNGGQIYGTMEGTVRGDRMNGTVRLTNLAQRRSDGVNLPTLRGPLTTDAGEQIWTELDGVATLRPADGARLFVTACRFRTGSAQYAWLNTVVGIVEGILDAVTVGGTARGHLYECRPTIT